MAKDVKISYPHDVAGGTWGWRKNRKRGHVETAEKKLLAELRRLQKNGATIEKKSDYQWRVNGILDVYPRGQRFHLLKTSERFTFDTIADALLYIEHPEEFE